MKLISFTAAAVAIASAVPTAVAARDSIQAAMWIPPSHQVSRYLYEQWAERVKTEGNGAIEVNVDLGSSMVSPRGAMAELADGIVDVSGHVAQYTPTELAVSNALEELGMRYSDPRAIMAAASDFGFNSPELQAEWNRNGIVFGAGYVTAPYKLICNQPITSIEDMTGAKLRLPGRAPAGWANSVGAVTVALNANEQYGALDKGALTCTTTTMADAHARKIHEVAGHVTELPITLFWAGYAWSYNPGTWADLTVEQRQNLFNAEAEAMAAYVYQGLGDEEMAAREKLAAAGVEFHEPAAELVASIDAYRNNQQNLAAGVAKETFGVANAEDLLGRFAKTVEKWEKLVAALPEGDEAAYADLLKSELFGPLDLAAYPAN